MMTEVFPDVIQRLAERVRSLRGARALSLDTLASRSGVSRSMISLVERGESSPTAVVLEKLAAGLGVTLAALFEVPTSSPSAAPHPLSRGVDQVEWKDLASGYRRRNVSPPNVMPTLQIVEVHFPAGARVAFDTEMREASVWQQVWVLDGRMHITVGDDCHELNAGDCLAMSLDMPRLFHNPTREASRYAVVLLTEAAPNVVRSTMAVSARTRNAGGGQDDHISSTAR